VNSKTEIKGALSGAQPTGTLSVAISQTKRLLGQNPSLAVEQAREILKTVPHHPEGMLLLGKALRAIGHTVEARRILTLLAAEQPNSAASHYELGLALGEGKHHEAAVASLKRALSLRAELPDAWRAIGDQLTIIGDIKGADAAYAQHLKTSIQSPRLLAAASALCANRIPQAELLLREYLKEFSTDIGAIRMLAEVAGRLGRNQDAETLLARCLELAPSFHGARYNYAIVLHRQNKPAAAMREIELLLAVEPRNPGYRNLKAVILARIGDYQKSIEIYADVLRSSPRQPAIWMSYGHALATAGQEQRSIEAYRCCIRFLPQCGEAYWSLANLKTYRFSAADLQEMLAQVQRTDISDEDRIHFHFAIGKAFEDSKQYKQSFEHYSSGNCLRHEQLDYDPKDAAAHVRRSEAVLTQQFFALRSGYGATAADPIFIVGLPRSGSTLVEQILASHPSVEGTMELPDIISMARRLSGKKKGSDVSKYPEVLSALSADECRALGDEYIERTRIQRKTTKPFFIDKMPNNFLHLGLIRLALPRAKIIDARRNPMACCFSAFKQHFAKGQHYTYSLENMGRYYHDYVRLMSHFDAVLPGVIHRVIYEQMVEDTEVEIRDLLAYCGLPFAASCLRFFENSRAVRTASSQQVRKPIFREGLDQWRHFEPWLGTLTASLGAVVAAYPATPLFTNCESVQ